MEVRAMLRNHHRIREDFEKRLFPRLFAVTVNHFKQHTSAAKRLTNTLTFFVAQEPFTTFALPTVPLALGAFRH
jgi:hypothetical protein